jgi:hypothetical protein
LYRAAVNEPKTIKAVVPSFPGPYFISIKTQGSAKSSSNLLKEIREVRSDFTLTLS